MSTNAQTFSKEYAALVQLHDAILLYYSGSCLSSITLAGAAEEILKKLSNEAMSSFVGSDVEHNQVDISFTFIAMMMAGAGPVYDELTDEEKKSVERNKKILYREHNYTRNALKHKDKGENIVESNNFKLEARKHIGSALTNYCTYKKKMPTEYPMLLRYCNEFGLNYN
jgi:hypothetical protein